MRRADRSSCESLGSTAWTIRDRRSGSIRLRRVALSVPFVRGFENECEPGMRAVDTNVLVRLLTADDAKQAAAAEAFVTMAGHAWISHIVLVETVWVLESV